jgi:hypothetical protein
MSSFSFDALADKSTGSARKARILIVSGPA